MENQIVEDNISPYILKNGQTMSIVSGSGGRGVRNQVRCGPTTYPYGCNQEWGSIYTANQSGKHGVLFCTFNVDGQPDKASCYFKDVDNATIDTFELINENYGEVVAPFCGDGFCNEDENCSSCFEDCGVCPPDAADQTINLISGWNVISLNTSAFVFSGDLDLDLIMGYGDNSWETDWKIFSGDEFVLKPLQGYYVYADKGKSLTFSGYELSSDYSLVNNTWNLFSVRSSDSFENIYGFSLDSGDLMQVILNEGSFIYSDVSGNLNHGLLYWAKIGDAQFGPVVQSMGVLEIILDFISNLASINGYFFKAIS